ncbi:MAG: YraN family protein [Paludibacteraceae bacterium]
MALHNDIGKLGEEIAANLLIQKRLKIRERNRLLGHLEIDIIAEDKKTIVFAEVKTRTTLFGDKTPAEYVDEAKKRRIVAAANAYVKSHRIEKSVRFDIIGILLHPKTHEVIELTHYENAFLPPVRTVNSHTYSGRWNSKPRRW